MTTPPNVRLGRNTVVTGDLAFKRFHSRRDPALVVGDHCTMDGVHFDLGAAGEARVGDHCYFTNAVLLCEERIEIGEYVVIGWNTYIADTDFHPISPALRVADAVAISPLAEGRPRPRIETRPVIIEDGVWIGPQVAVLKGVRIGRGAVIEAGSVVSADVRAGARVMGNPAREVAEAPA